MRETGQGAFRESADEDPHGTRAIAMRLTPAGRELLSRPAAPLWPRFLFIAGSIAVLAALRSRELALGTGVMGAVLLAWAVSERLTPRFRIDHEGLTVVSAWGRAVSHRWRDVTRFTLGRDAARATIGGGQTIEARAVRRGDESWLGLDQAVMNADLVIERGAHRTALTCMAFIALAMIAGFVGVVTLAWGFAASTAALLVVYLAMRAPDVVLSADGIDTGFAVLPWSAITGAARRNRLIGQTVHVRMEDGSERSFIVLERARAEALAAELMRRKAAALTAPGAERST